MGWAISMDPAANVLTGSGYRSLSSVLPHDIQTGTNSMKTVGILLAAAGAAGLIAATKPSTPVKGVSYRVRTQTALPNFGAPGGGGGGGGGGGDQPFGGRGFGGGAGSQLVRVDMAGNRAKVEFQL